MHDSEDFYDGLLGGLFWFFWPKGLWQWLLYVVLFAGIYYAKEHAKPAEPEPIHATNLHV